MTDALMPAEPNEAALAALQRAYWQIPGDRSLRPNRREVEQIYRTLHAHLIAHPDNHLSEIARLGT